MSRIGPDQQRLTPAERANLVAYLDGELNEAEAQSLSTKLTHSATARRELDALKSTWDLLDALGRPLATDSLTERTLTGVRLLDEQGGKLESAFSELTARVLRATAWVAVTLAVLASGYALTRWVWPDPTSRLMRDFPLAEHLDEYRDVGNFEFLNELANSPEFGGERKD